MKYCRFHLNGSAHYGLVESVAGSDEITRLLLQAPQDSGGDVEGLPSRRMDHIPLAQASLLPPGGTILRPKVSERTDYEGELGVVIARRCHRLADSEDVRPYILGYTCVNDFTARDLQKKEPQWV